MSKNARQFAAAGPDLVLIGAVILAFIVACSSEPTKPPPLDVPQAWALVRTLPGHAKHLLRPGISCEDCHDLSVGGFTSPGSAPCGKCHVSALSIRHAMPPHGGGQSDCLMCHNFSRAERESNAPEAPWDCIRCHKAPQNDLPAIEIHGSAPCKSCHAPHAQQQPQADGCTGCHQEVISSHKDLGLSADQACSSCHQHHHAGAKEAQGSCDGCHGKDEPLVSSALLFSPGHGACTDCHKAHDFAKPVGCESCHTNQHTLAEKRVPQHTTCTSCHPAHNAKFDANRACEGCHKRQLNDHPSGQPGVHAGRCTSCHDAHSAMASSTAACSSCHKEAHNDKAFHAEGVACTACHVPHQFTLSSSHGGALKGNTGHGNSAPCASCHGTQLAAVHTVAGHGDCNACHNGLPHHPTTEKPCASCHANEAHDKHSSSGACTSCHEPHGGTLQKACSACHAAEHRSAPRGHSQCLTCHQGHGEKLSQTPACTTCHKTEARAPHGQLPGGCGNCHRAHGPEGPSTPPTCNSCHAPTKLPALHTIAAHTDCSDCHRAHETQPRVEPDVCRACHKQQEQHFPGVDRCSGCHQFKNL